LTRAVDAAPVDASASVGLSELSSVQFAQVARRLNQSAQAGGLCPPAFRSPPRTPGLARSITRRADGSATVSVRLRGRPAVAVVADMIDGIVAANRPPAAPAPRNRRRTSRSTGSTEPSVSGTRRRSSGSVSRPEQSADPRDRLWAVALAALEDATRPTGPTPPEARPADLGTPQAQTSRHAGEKSLDEAPAEPVEERRRAA
jgi:hypothetical protein